MHHLKEIGIMEMEIGMRSVSRRRRPNCAGSLSSKALVSIFQAASGKGPTPGTLFQHLSGAILVSAMRWEWTSERLFQAVARSGAAVKFLRSRFDGEGEV
jgi:hypothetical protein